jgi:parallel beta-helix repeat protein
MKTYLCLRMLYHPTVVKVRKPVIILLCMAVLFSTSYLAEDTSNDVVGQPVGNEKTAYNVSTPFRINSNAEFASMASARGWPGDGSLGNPYIIDNYDINGTGYGYCIFVGNTTVYFTIQNCYLHEAGTNEGNPGLDLQNVQNGTVTNNTATNNYFGIHLQYSYNNILIKNNASANNYMGIVISSSNNNIIANNTASSNPSWGISFSSSSGNTVDNNTAYLNWMGIVLWGCKNNKVAGNIMSKNNFGGIYICWGSNNNTIANNYVFSNNNYGILLEYSAYNNTIVNNTVSYNHFGILLHMCGDNNNIYHNNFINNTGNIQFDDGANQWDNSYPSGGNYWSDYTGTDVKCGSLQDQPGSDGIGDTPYQFSGGQDNYPLMSPFDYTEYNISLQQGWNLISLPVRQLNESIDSVLESIAGKWDYIQTYDVYDASDHWKSNMIYRPASLNDLTTMNHLKSYWINIIEPGVTLTVKGDKFGSALSIPLKAGWNLIGYPFLAQKSISDALLGTGYDSVEGFNTSDPYRTSVLPGSYMMKPSEGYWVHVPADTIWTINW